MGEGERGTKTTVLLLEAPYKDRALAGAALIDLLPLGHSSCSMLYRRSYLQCELPLPSSQATLQHPGSSTNAFTSQAPRSSNASSATGACLYHLPTRSSS